MLHNDSTPLLTNLLLYLVTEPLNARLNFWQAGFVPHLINGGTKVPIEPLLPLPDLRHPFLHELLHPLQPGLEPSQLAAQLPSPQKVLLPALQAQRRTIQLVHRLDRRQQHRREIVEHGTTTRTFPRFGVFCGVFGHERAQFELVEEVAVLGARGQDQVDVLRVLPDQRHQPAQVGRKLAEHTAIGRILLLLLLEHLENLGLDFVLDGSDALLLFICLLLLGFLLNHFYGLVGGHEGIGSPFMECCGLFLESHRPRGVGTLSGAESVEVLDRRHADFVGWCFGLQGGLVVDALLDDF